MRQDDAGSMARPPRRATKIGLVLKRGAQGALVTAQEVVSELRARGVEVYGEDDPWAAQSGALPRDGQRFADGLDVVVVLGGDGTFIQAARLVGQSGVPILGVNLGGLGFLTVFSTAELRELLDWVVAGEYRVEERFRLHVSLIREGREIFQKEVLNDAVINQGSLARIIDIEARLDDLAVTTYKADGLIVATPTGSTAYALAAGGPILTPGIEAMILAPICPHTLTNRPLVVPSSSEVHLILRSDRGQVFLTLDGQTGQSMLLGDEVRIRAGSRLRTVVSPFTDYFGILRAKLHGGAREGH
jgi:NAD+ kinase